MALLVALGVVYPIGYVVVLSAHDYSPFQMRAMQFVGAGNYQRLLGDPEFWASLRAGAIWVAGSVVPQFLLGLAMALVLNERFRGRGLVRTIVLVPWVVSGVVTGIIWTWLFDGTVGVVNDLLMRAGLVGAPVAWTVQPATTWLALFVANAWRGAPFFAIVLLAALQSISPELYEAAKIDGAGRWQRFRFVTLPLVLGTVDPGHPAAGAVDLQLPRPHLDHDAGRAGPPHADHAAPRLRQGVHRGRLRLRGHHLVRALRGAAGLQRPVLAAPPAGPRGVRGARGSPGARRRRRLGPGHGLPGLHALPRLLAGELVAQGGAASCSRSPPLLAGGGHGRQLPDAIRQTRLAALYLNSLWISSVTCLALMALIVFSGYAMARFRFRGKAWLVALFLLAQVLPHVVLLLPFFTMFKVAGLINTRLALVVAYTVITLPFSVLTMRGFFAAIPVELDEAAMVDGCGRSGALFRVVLPAALPGLVATSIYGFINAWNELILAVVLINSPNLQTLPVGLSSLIDENRTEYGMLMAVAVLSLVPSLVFFGWIQRYLTTGLSAGAVKG